MDFTKECWSCGYGSMVPKGNYYQCSNCGATWNELPLPSSFGLVEESMSRYARVTKYRPSLKKSRFKAKAKR